MIELEQRGTELVVCGSCAGRLFADGAWVAAGPLRGVLVAEGAVVGPDGTALDGIPADEPGAVAAAVFFALAECAARALEGCPPGPVEVLGDGVIARAARELLEERMSPGAQGHRPAAVLDTTGDPASIADAVRRLGDLGYLVLAAPPAGRLDLDLYPDIHVRGLQIVGVSTSPQIVREVLRRGLHRGILDRECPSVRVGDVVDGQPQWLDVHGSPRALN